MNSAIINHTRDIASEKQERFHKKESSVKRFKQGQPAIRHVIRNICVGFAICCLGACGTLSEQVRNGVLPKPLNAPDAGDKAEVYSEIAAAQKKQSEAFVQIVSGDIELPLTAGQDRPNDNRNYYIDVWFDNNIVGVQHDEDKNSLEEAIKDGNVIVEVLGAKAKISVAEYGDDAPLKRSRSKIVVEVNSRDLTQSFTVIAKSVADAGRWQMENKNRLDRLLKNLMDARKACDAACEKYLNQNRNRIVAHGSRAIGADENVARNYILAGERYEAASSEQNPYMAVKVIRVFNGDLHTQVYMLSEEETQDAFGTNFAKYFYVGKAYFRNRHTDKKLIVHTTSLRARTVFYREPVSDGIETSWLGEFFRSDRNRGDGPRKNSAYAPYDHILSLPSDDDLEKVTLTRSEELQIIEVAHLETTIKDLQERSKRIEDIEDALMDRIAKQMDIVVTIIKTPSTSQSGKSDERANENARRYRRVKEFLAFSLKATRHALFDCEALEPQSFEAELQSQMRYQVFQTLEKTTDFDVWLDSVIKQKEKKEVRDQKKKFAENYADCIRRSFSRQKSQRDSDIFPASPVALDMRKRVGLTGKIAAASRDTAWQQRLSRHGYLWQDYYRPMTFEAVLISLTEKTNRHPKNRAIDYLQSIGVIAGSLVGLTEISSRLGTEDFAQRVAVSTGVFVPELRKLLLRDLDQYLANLAATALPSIITLAPNESRDGYVFFPRGPIYGYGVDEFSLDDPSFIINIDNEDVSVDGALIEGELAFASGQKAMDMVQAARNQGKSVVNDDMKKLADLQAKLYEYRLQNIASTACEMISFGAAPASVNNYLDIAILGIKDAKGSELINELRARAAGGVTCDKEVSKPKPNQT